MRPHLLPLLLVVLLLQPSCRKDDFEINNLNGGKIIALGHGGMGIHSTYPMNSAASLLSCMNSGADGTEMDVQLTRDDVLVAFHDENLSVSTDHAGVVADLSWSEVQDARYIQLPYTEHPVIRVGQFFENLDGSSGHQFYFDVKTYHGGQDPAAYNERMADALATLIQQHGIASQVVIECADAGFLAGMRARVAGLRLFIYRGSFQEALDIAVQEGFDGVVYFTENITKDQIAGAHAHGKWVAILAQTRREQREAIEMNPEIILSDRLDHLLDLLD